MDATEKQCAKPGTHLGYITGIPGTTDHLVHLHQLDALVVLSALAKRSGMRDFVQLHINS